MIVRSGSLRMTENIAQTFVKKLAPNSAGAFVVGLYGDLGSGKTTFVQATARALGVRQNVTSPTFVIMKSYSLNAKRYSVLIHIDAYRLNSGKELEALGWKEIIHNPNNIIFLEWPERVSEILPRSIRKINFTFIDENTREIDVAT